MKKRFVLSDAKNGVLADADNTAINKTGASEVTYKTSADLKNSENKIIYHTLTTPRRGIAHYIGGGSFV